MAHLSHMPSNPETLTDLLNKIWAIHYIRLMTFKQIGDQIDVDQRSVSNWVTQRRRNPDGDSAFKLKNFAETMTLKISKRPRLWSRYKAAYAAAGILFPVEGSEK